MKDVLEVYHRPYNQARPLVCLDETTKQLVGDRHLSTTAYILREKEYLSYLKHMMKQRQIFI